MPLFVGFQIFYVDIAFLSTKKFYFAKFLPIFDNDSRILNISYENLLAFSLINTQKNSHFARFPNIGRLNFLEYSLFARLNMVKNMVKPQDQTDVRPRKHSCYGKGKDTEKRFPNPASIWSNTWSYTPANALKTAFARSNGGNAYSTKYSGK